MQDMTEKYRLIDHPMIFKTGSGTSRGILHSKGSQFIVSTDEGKLSSIGEVSTIPKLSPEPEAEIASYVSERIEDNSIDILAPAVDFGIEMWQRSKVEVGSLSFFDSPFARGESGIPINGLIWMGEKNFMREQIKKKIKDGFRCIKLKIGAIEFEEELSLLAAIREDYNSDDMEIRVDANGAFSPEDALDKLNRLSEYALHSIEQPIRQGQWESMAHLCRETPIPIALDEELIGITQKADKESMLNAIKPQYIILKPSLVGGWAASQEWIEISKSLDIGWWITSALESNVGLHAIASWADTLESDLPQGLGTGGLFSNNIPSPLEIRNAQLWFNPEKDWGFSILGI